LIETKNMKFKRSDSNGSIELLDLAEALVNYARNRQQLLDFAHAIWPRLYVYEGHTHWRFMVNGSDLANTFVVDFSQDPATTRQQALAA
jgi:hypothetical protein